MKGYFLLIIAVCIAAGGIAQEAQPDTILTAELKEVKVKAKWKNDTARYRYNQMKFYVTTILPYLNAATKVFKEVQAKSDEPGISKKERKRFISAQEDEMRTQFEDRIKDLNVTQGVLLVKLIARQTELNIYKVLVDFRNPVVAIKWQAWSRLHGIDLNRKYHPEDEPNLELIMEDLGYPLPASYAVNEIQ